MKKRTVITTEKREVWVIHHPPVNTAQDPRNGLTEVPGNVPDLLPQGHIQTETPTHIQNDEEQ